jgi:hypothetical protein
MYSQPCENSQSMETDHQKAPLSYEQHNYERFLCKKISFISH